MAVNDEDDVVKETDGRQHDALTRPARTKKVHSKSARPTNPATASQWIGNNVDAPPAIMVTAAVITQ
ncbi:Uncharacterized protein APZ42_022889 [Daphnia magna]|uniref:Uncharacterized protein n=1 Tax=Daphnia magna TaxID=35525 RepID=A0A164VVT3_9CRUS|nr:Uncharacterized protein APZ42_022889 [Daphnia magna]